MFHDPFYAKILVKSWERIVRRVAPYRDVIYGYDIVNEPNQNTPAASDCDQVSVIKRAIAAIRAVDTETPVVVEAWADSARTLEKYTAMGDIGPVILSIHIYQPHDFMHQGILTPLDRVEYWPNPAKRWNAEFLRRSLKPVIEFQKEHDAKIFVGEFSAISWAPEISRVRLDCHRYAKQSSAELIAEGAIS